MQRLLPVFSNTGKEFAHQAAVSDEYFLKKNFITASWIAAIKLWNKNFLTGGQDGDVIPVKMREFIKDLTKKKGWKELPVPFII